jgi:hypothetical protein
MKMIDARFIKRRVFLLFGVILGASPALGQEFPEARAAAELSITQGFKQSSLPVLHRLGVDAPDAVSAALVEKLCFAPCPSLTRRTPGNLVELASAQWSLQVLGDGSAARFRDSQVATRAHSLAREKTEKTSFESLLRTGRAYIDANLASVIRLGPEEGLVPLRADYRTEAGQNLRTQEFSHSVVANRVVFGRTVRDLPIVGGGSRVVLTFANDGSLESFQYDWPKYQTANVQHLVNMEAILDRVQRIVAFRMGLPASAPSARVPTRQGTNALELMKNTVLQKLECGYYDPGLLVRDSNAPVQAGCVYYVIFQDEAGSRMGFSGAVPGAVQIEPDATWAEAVILRGRSAGERPTIPGPSRAP